MNNRDQVARLLAGALPARETGGHDGAVIDTRTIKRAIGALEGASSMAATKPKGKPFTKKTAKAAATKRKTNPLAAAKARVAKLEKTTAARTMIAKGKAMLKAASGRAKKK